MKQLLRVLLLLLLWAAAPARAFLIQTYDNGQGPVRLFWRNPDKIPFRLDRAGSDDLPAETVYRILRESFAVWAAVPGSRVGFVDQGLAELDAPSGDDRVNMVIFDETGDWLQAPHGTGIIALTRMNSNSFTGEIGDADILFNGRDFRFGEGGQANRVELKDVAVHEIGHLIGLDHSPLDGPAQIRPTMNPYYGDDGPGAASTLEADDQAGAGVLYPSANFLTGEARITGTVKDGQGQPLFGAHLVAENLDTGERYGTLSGAFAGTRNRGDYVLRGLSPGQYRLRLEPVSGRISAQNFGGVFSSLPVDFPAEYYDNVADSAWAQVLSLRSGQRLEGIDFATGLVLAGYPSLVPEVLPGNTPDQQGPYTVRVRAQGAERVELGYRTAVGGQTRTVAMKALGQDRYSATIPGQATGTQLSYQIRAYNRQGQATVHPHADHWLDFEVVALSGAPLVFSALRELDQLSILDTGDLRELARVPVGDEPIQVLLAPDGRRLYIASLGAGQIYVVSTATFQVVDRISVAAEPLDLSLSPDGKTLYVTNSGASSLTALNLGAGTTRRFVLPQVQDGPYGVAATRTGIYVTDLNNNRVLALDLSGKEVARIGVPAQPRSLALSRDLRRLYTTSLSRNQLTVIETARNRVVRSVTLPVTGTFAAAVSPDGRRIYLTAHEDSAVVILDARTETVLKTLKVGADPRAISFAPGGKQALVTSAGSAEIAVISVAGDSLLQRYATRSGLRGIAVVPVPLQSVSGMQAGGRPAGLTLDPAAPNPFNAGTQISFSLAQTGQADLAVYNVLGQQVRVLVGAVMEAGNHQVVWDGRDQAGREAASGMYLAVLRSGDHQTAQKLMLLR
ncbi:MAG: matrixin family metalloprotease [Candidatus Latescibacteria bacterium]|nr:matrixin family metalloprotease [Candidatus Latescibacterota bacterium]